MGVGGQEDPPGGPGVRGGGVGLLVWGSGTAGPGSGGPPIVGGVAPLPGPPVVTAGLGAAAATTAAAAAATTTAATTAATNSSNNSSSNNSTAATTTAATSSNNSSNNNSSNSSSNSSSSNNNSSNSNNSSGSTFAPANSGTAGAKGAAEVTRPWRGRRRWASCELHGNACIHSVLNLIIVVTYRGQNNCLCIDSASSLALTHMLTVEPPNKGHIGTTFVERLSSLRRSKMYKHYRKMNIWGLE